MPPPEPKTSPWTPLFLILGIVVVVLVAWYSFGAPPPSEFGGFLLGEPAPPQVNPAAGQVEQQPLSTSSSQNTY